MENVSKSISGVSFNDISVSQQLNERWRNLTFQDEKGGVVYFGVSVCVCAFGSYKIDLV